MDPDGEYADEYDEGEDEFITDPGDFDGGFGEGSYFWHAMNKDD
jgi:hypothetical protein